MRYVSWSPALETGYAEVDDQHHELYALVNDLNAAALVGADSEQIEHMLHRILRYASVHFATEEGLMARSSYPDAPTHISIHAAFAEQAQSLANDYSEGRGMSVIELAAFMQDWLESHIRSVDQPLVGHLREWRESEARND
jgi:hemerythrin-like metal-binding protein